MRYIAFVHVELVDCNVVRPGSPLANDERILLLVGKRETQNFAYNLLAGGGVAAVAVVDTALDGLSSAELLRPVAVAGWELVSAALYGHHQQVLLVESGW